MQTATLATGAIVPLEGEQSCSHCGEVEPSFKMVESELHCEQCYTLAKANQIVHSGLDAIIENLVDQIPQSDWHELAWRISVGFGGEPCLEGINWECEVID